MLGYPEKTESIELSDFSTESRKKLNWIKFGLLLGIVVLSVVVYYLHLLPSRYHELLVFFFIMSISCNIIPIPTYPLILYISHDYQIWLIALIGAVGATISALLEYHILDFLLGFERVAKLKNHKKYKKYASYFDRFSFRSIILASSIPVPIDLVRVLAISRKYSKWKFALATFLGRVPRFFLIAFLGSQLAYAKRIAVILLVATLLIELIRRFWKVLQRQPVMDRSY